MPAELTRTFPRPVFATPTVADCPLAVFGAACAVELPPLPQPAKASDASSTAAALAMKVHRLVSIMRVLSLGRSSSFGKGRGRAAPCLHRQPPSAVQSTRNPDIPARPQRSAARAFALGSPHELVG